MVYNVVTGSVNYKQFPFLTQEEIMLLWTFWFLNLLVGYLVTSSSIPSYSILAKNDTLFVHRGRNAVLNWIMVSYPSTNQTIKCTAKHKNTVIASGAYHVAKRRFVFTIPQESQSKFDFRLHGVVYVQPHNSNMLSLTIENSKAIDSDKYICTYGQKSSEINLQVYSDLVEMGKPVPSIVLTEKRTVSIELCAAPEPHVTMELLGVVTHIKGVSKPSSNCYVYYFQNLTLTEQKHCGEELKLVYQGVKKTLRRSVKLIIPLSARAPTNVQIRNKDDGECPVVRWDGPNIGSCISNSIWYDIAIFKHSRIVRRMRTSSNIIEACGIDFLQKDMKVKVRNILGNTNSTWSHGNLILEQKPYDGMQTAIIACAALAGFLLILLSAYCFYRHKYSIVKFCTRELAKSVSEEEDDEIQPLNNTLASSISPQKQQQPQPTEPQKTEKESKRKTSRKISLDTFLSDHYTRKNSSGAAEQNKVATKPNHSTRFYSLQRNIERERKKLEEQELEQKQDDVYANRRNTDSKVFQDFKNNLNQHHFGPRLSGDSQETQATGPPGSPLYDVLPSTRSSTSNTRSSASTNSTGPSYHEEDERPPLSARRRNTAENSSLMPPDTNNTAPLYDVLPRTNSNLVQQLNHVDNNKHYPPMNETQVYDYIPSIKTKDKNGYTPINDGIYDVPVKPTQQTTNGDATATEVKYTPFSSHKKQNTYNNEKIHENS